MNFLMILTLTITLVMNLGRVVTDDACKDDRPNCEKMKRFCDVRPNVMKKLCSETCGFCKTLHQETPTSTCTDLRPGCHKVISFCSAKPHVMTKYCQKTCDFCSSSEKNNPNSFFRNKPSAIIDTNPNIIGEEEELKLVSDCKDIYGSKRCKEYAEAGHCEKYERLKTFCKASCVCNRPKHCSQSQFGCCMDNQTTKEDSNGRNCPALDCSDDIRFASLCIRYTSEDCKGSQALALSLQKNCKMTCGLCQ